MHDLFLNKNCKIQTLMTFNAVRKDYCDISRFLSKIRIYYYSTFESNGKVTIQY